MHVENFSHRRYSFDDPVNEPRMLHTSFSVPNMSQLTSIISIHFMEIGLYLSELKHGYSDKPIDRQAEFTNGFQLCWKMSKTNILDSFCLK